MLEDIFDWVERADPEDLLQIWDKLYERPDVMAMVARRFRDTYRQQRGSASVSEPTITSRE